MKELVAKGCALLDEHRPGWHRRINLEKLDMGSASCCVLGQEFLNFSDGKVKLGLEVGRDYGFALHASDLRFNHHLAWGELRKLWVEEIETRLLRDELEAGVSSEAEEELALA